MAAKFTAFTSTMVRMPIDNIDTDQIIPARFLKTISKTGVMMRRGRRSRSSC